MLSLVWPVRTPHTVSLQNQKAWTTFESFDQHCECFNRGNKASNLVFYAKSTITVISGQGGEGGGGNKNKRTKLKSSNKSLTSYPCKPLMYSGKIRSKEHTPLFRHYIIPSPTATLILKNNICCCAGVVGFLDLFFFSPSRGQSQWQMKHEHKFWILYIFIPKILFLGETPHQDSTEYDYWQKLKCI